MDLDLKCELANVYSSARFSQLGECYEGKVRDNYILRDRRVIITSDRLSCFDKVVTSIPFKGQVLQHTALSWFKECSGIVNNHILDVIDPQVMVVKQCQVLPIEVVVRGYLAGSAWRDYLKGTPVSGVVLPPGLKQFCKLPEVIITPSTKADRGDHDMPISESELVKRGIVSSDLWQQVREVALALFARGSALAAERGLILADTKYELGLHNGALILVDEIHTLDSSRFWLANTWRSNLQDGEQPKMLDKEPVRQWLLDRGFNGEGEIPEISDEMRIQVAQHYIDAAEQITGIQPKLVSGPAVPRISESIMSAISSGAIPL